ncbi:hypothetical protein SNOG_13676 [Parastagonospora nodorum SN15]|uniref:Uncharacterized protein n=1 Tax=Phaeosphaeria nodorum (strain SN15 / ATCC MYA-4574 / FGSC 10173) TaxID=321614 RepID=Q0U3I8_PHANO|nr:hypothetical protein SNOG_13676 [Parastagonospora nodorum SN15]EAT79123.1 hypothetical protein SNOG_13676 [Parastagonospora nodorum SN15]
MEKPVQEPVKAPSPVVWLSISLEIGLERLMSQSWPSAWLLTACYPVKISVEASLESGGKRPVPFVVVCGIDDDDDEEDNEFKSVKLNQRNTAVETSRVGNFPTDYHSRSCRAARSLPFVHRAFRVLSLSSRNATGPIDRMHGKLNVS